VGSGVVKIKDRTKRHHIPTLFKKNLHRSLHKGEINYLRVFLQKMKIPRDDSSVGSINLRMCNSSFNSITSPRVSIDEGFNKRTLENCTLYFKKVAEFRDTKLFLFKSPPPPLFAHFASTYHCYLWCTNHKDLQGRPFGKYHALLLPTLPVSAANRNCRRLRRYLLPPLPN
jgi:hypothetical protein